MNTKSPPPSLARALPLLALLFMAYLYALPARAQQASLSPQESERARVFAEAAPSAVFVTQARMLRRPFQRTATLTPTGSGSGFVWDESGHIITNFHVVDRGDAFVVTLHDTRTYEARLVGADPATDLAVLKLVKPPTTLRPLPRPPIGTEPIVGQDAQAIGNPYGLDHTLTSGVVSAVGRQIQGYGGVSIRGMIQTDASINQGNSGGPLLNGRGELLGVNTMMYSRSGSSAGIGFAVPVSTVERIVPQLIESGRVTRVQLGLELLPATVSRRAGVRGVVIERVGPGSLAADAGLSGLRAEKGRIYMGDVILEVNGTPIASPDDYFHALDAHESGAPISLTVARDGELRTVTITM